MERLPLRGPEARAAGVPLPPDRMPILRRGRPLKRWRYVGVFGPELMLCAGEARVGPIPQRWWALAQPGGRLQGRTSLSRGGVRLSSGGHGSGAAASVGRVDVDAGEVQIELALEPPESEAVEVLSPSGEAYVWTRKQAMRARGSVHLGDGERRLDAGAIVDHSAGYHERHTAWRWSAGVGRAASGEAVAWNLVTGVHDAAEASERTLWVEGQPAELGPVSFAADLSSVSFAEGGALAFSEWAAREETTNLLLFRSRYRQPFGTFRGELPGGLRLAEGYGVMEEHDVRW